MKKVDLGGNKLDRAASQWTYQINMADTKKAALSSLRAA